MSPDISAAETSSKSSSAQNTSSSKNEEELKYKAKAAAFLTFAGGLGLFGGFGAALASAKKQDPKAFDQGLVPKATDLAKVKAYESGAALASRALAWGSFWAFAGCGVLFGSIWKLSGARDFREFREKVGGILPAIPKKPSEGRTEFSGLNDFLQYIIDRDRQEQEAKKAAAAASLKVQESAAKKAT